MAVMNASRGVTRASRPHNEAMVSSAFKMFSVAVSSVLKNKTNISFTVNTSKIIIIKKLGFLDILLFFPLIFYLPGI